MNIPAQHPYDQLTPDRVLDAVESIGLGESLILTVFSGFALQGIPHSNKFRLAL